VSGVGRRARARVSYTREMRRRGGLARVIVLVTTSLAVGVAVACGTAPTEDPAIALPERAPSDDAGDGASIPDALGVDVAVADAPAGPCTNGKLDGAETDVDCGGPTCAPCANGKACLAHRDCAARACMASTCNGDVGCADATREGFTSLVAFANIAACAGAWSLPGLLAPGTKTPACSRASGNNGANAAGAGCNVADLCQLGWHVCASAAEVGVKSGNAGCAGAATAGMFFATRQSGPGAAQCGAGTNDLFGCGGIGAGPDPGTCAPLGRTSGDLCSALSAGWACGPDAFQEANDITHTVSTNGGVLCCRD
jgi:hypothetical protein